MRLFTVTVAIKIVLVIVVFLILIVIFIVIELTRERHSAISAVTSEIELRVEFNHFMIIVTVDHTTQAKPMRF
jgi:hypothetical protein